MKFSVAALKGWPFCASVLAFLVIEIFYSTDYYWGQSKHASTAMDVFQGLLTPALAFALPAGVVGALVGWLTHKLLTHKHQNLRDDR